MVPQASPASKEKEKNVDLTGLLRQAQALAPQERQELLDRLALMASEPVPGTERDIEMWSASIYKALQSALGESAGAMGGPMLIKRIVAAPSSWRPVEKFMQASRLDQLPVRERQAVYVMLADLLVKHARHVARRASAPLSPKFVANCTGSISGVFDAAFPGYLHAGLAHIVARQLAMGAAAN